MILAWLLLLTGLTISAVAIYYSVVGLTAIFSAAVIPIIIMGSALEVGKLVCASWLKANWERAPFFMKAYMTSAVVVLMLITSMGIFGFLSKAHSDSGLVSGDVQAKIAVYDEKIKTAKENIEANRKVLKQMDEAVDQVMGRSQDEKGADKAVALRRSQQKERARLTSEIAAEQKTISSLTEERAPIAAEVRKVEAEVGPLKYIAKFIYDDHVNENMLEKAVTWIIILIVVVFDPLAVIMLLGAQMTFSWAREQKRQEENTPDPYVADVGEKPTAKELESEQEETPTIPRPWPFPSAQVVKEQNDELVQPQTQISTGEQTEAPVEQSDERESLPGDQGEGSAKEENKDPVEQWNEMIAAAEEAVKWSKEQKDQTPEEAAQAEQWAQEQVPDTTPNFEGVKVDDQWVQTGPEFEEPKKKDLHDEGTGTASDQGTQVGYVQNAEQGSETLWSRIQGRASKSKDELYRLYDRGEFEKLAIDQNTDPDLYKFVEETKTRGPKFANYRPETLTSFVERIYELRENQRNNPA